MAPGWDPAPAAPPGLLLALLLLPRLLGAAPGAPPQPPAAAPEGPAISCVAPAPSLAWFLDGEDGGGGRRLRLALRPGRLERTLHNCSAAAASDPEASDEAAAAAEASVLLEVHFQPELLQTEAPREEEQEEGGGSGALALALLVLVEAHPAARITWTDPEGRPLLLGNAAPTSASRFLLLDAKTYPWPPEQALRLQLQLSLRGHQAHAPNTSLPLSGLLATRVELPLVVLVLGCAGALGAFLCLGSLLGCLLCQRRRRAKEAKAAAAGPPFLVPLPPRDPSRLKPQMPRANTSLPADLLLNSFSAEATGQEKAAGNAPVEEEEERALSEPENHLVLVERGRRMGGHGNGGSPPSPSLPPPLHFLGAWQVGKARLGQEKQAKWGLIWGLLTGGHLQN
ncbi:transmembrane protein 25 isoform X2 [Sceloporus undulatus]|uniref:transmembrane protein 25 isoform X2 n=1 Tax=Sceloporus undulatus TaxID=8520 RepID=UPI001C4BD295|nr:transmembrane protein 25 isoform X2 [Sceloporus undulatus]